VLENVIDVILFLSTQNPPFRGHRKSFESANQGNFLDKVKLQAKYNAALSKHLSDIQLSKRTVTTYLSLTIQNELILLFGKKVKTLILEGFYETLNTLQSCVRVHLTYLIRIKWLLWSGTLQLKTVLCK